MKKVEWGKAGFTIVELLIVIVVIAILAAITLIAYNGVTDRAKASAAASATEQADKKVLTYLVTNSDQVPTDLATAGVTDQNGTTYQYSTNTAANPQTFCITATTNNISYFVNNTTQTTPTPGGCPGHGINGNAPLTNLATNPSFEVTTTPWAPGNTAVISRSTAEAHSGTASLLMTTTGASQYSYFATTSSGGRTYSVSLWAKGTGTLRVYFSRAPSGVSLGAGVTIPLTSSWQRYTTTATTDAPTVSINTIIWQNATGNNTIYVDDVIFTETSTPQNYADGNSPNWIWNGTTNNSTSTGPAL